MHVTHWQRRRRSLLEMLGRLAQATKNCCLVCLRVNHFWGGTLALVIKGLECRRCSPLYINPCTAWTIAVALLLRFEPTAADWFWPNVIARSGSLMLRSVPQREAMLHS